MSEKKNRYPGISPFTENDKNLFFGRDKDIENLKNLILLRKKVLLYAKSGVGKTSLLNAGVIPLIKDEYCTLKIRFTVYTKDSKISPVQAVINKLRDETNTEDIYNPSVLDELVEIKNYKKTLWYFFKQRQFLMPQTTYLLIFDQFEEIFTYPSDQINEFKDQLHEIIELEIPDEIIKYFAEHPELEVMNGVDNIFQPLKIKILFSIRSDRLSKLNLLSDKISNIQENYYELQPLTDDQAKSAIVEPGKIKSLEYKTLPINFQSEALDKILNQLTTPKNVEEEKLEVETTQLQIICHRIEENIIKRGITVDINQEDFINITASDLPNLKNVFLDFYYDAISKVKADEPERIFKFIENQLIIDERRISLDGRVCRKHVNQETLTTLVDAHLLRAELNSVNEISYELSHDALVPPIHEAAEERKEKEEEKLASLENERRLENEREKAEIDRIEYEKEIKRQNELLRLQEEKANEAEKAKYLAIENAENQKKAAEKQRKLLYIIGFFAIAFLFSAIFVYLKMDEANELKVKAEQDKIISDSLKNIAQSEKEKAEKYFKQVTIVQYEKLLAEAHSFANENKYNDAINKLQDARILAPDTLLIDSFILKYNNSDKTALAFNTLIGKAESLEDDEKNWLKKLEYYRQASKLRPDNSSVNISISGIEKEINNQLAFYKEQIEKFWDDGRRDLILRDFITPALKLCGGNCSDFIYFESKRKQCLK